MKEWSYSRRKSCLALWIGSDEVVNCIRNVSVLPLKIPLKAPYVLANVTQYAAEYVLVQIETDNGIIGIGEAAPFPGETEETQCDIVPIIQTYLTGAVIGKDIFDLESIHQAMDLATPGHPFAKAGIDIAVYDAIGKTLGIPVHKFIGGGYRTSVPVLGGMGVPKDAADAKKLTEAILAQGFKTIKMKVGRGLDKDVETVAAVREAAGPGINIRIDANQAYRADQAIRILRALEKYQLELIEQPLPAWDWEGMAKVTAALDTPIMVDEPIITAQDVIKTYEKKAGDIVKIKVMRCGGIYKALKVCATAEACGFPVVLGSGHESGIGVAAELHLASALQSIPYTGEMNGNTRLQTDIIENRITFSNGIAITPTEPGLGVGEINYAPFIIK
jgi:L-Ala-D/L-Glu epimerase